MMINHGNRQLYVVKHLIGASCQLITKTPFGMLTTKGSETEWSEYPSGGP
jgi:hypothetical protein